MRSFTLISSLIFLILSIACTSTGDDVTSPALPNLLNEENDLDGFKWECRANMRTIASQAVMFFANNSRYPKSLGEIGLAGLACPACGLTYQLAGTEFVFYVSCPMPVYPNHGYIDNGVPSWLHDPELEEYRCREKMEAIAIQAAIFFANNSRYPENLEELGMESYKCPTCGLSYNYYTYEDFAANPAYYI
ncbi:MAG: hypothetical protein K8S62_10055, partial [Candidatus Sabulitectum sp.]|nr:hypothetical protein [Candidatus Sabulitectum sp.]